MHVLRGWNVLGITGSNQHLGMPGVPGRQGLERRGLWDAVHVRGMQPWQLLYGWARSMCALPGWKLLDRLWAGIVHTVPAGVEHGLDWVELVVAMHGERNFACEEHCYRISSFLCIASKCAGEMLGV